jgi:hypothetical protein
MTTIPDRDQEALQLAIERCRAEDAERDRQIVRMLGERPWRRVAEFAAYSCQMVNLKLQPWDFPPCWVEPDDYRHRQAAKLLREMLEAGVSKYHPDPLAAIEAAKAVQP